MKTIFPYNKESKNGLIKSRIIEYFINNGNATNTDISKEFNLSSPTIARIINEMCQEGFVLEYGKLETEEGRHPNLFGLNPDSGYFIGVDINPTFVNIGLMNIRGDLIDLFKETDYIHDNSKEALERLCEIIHNYTINTSVSKEKILNININIGGRINPDTGYSYSVFNFSEASLSSMLTEKLGYQVTIENDTRAMAFGEYMEGCVQGEKNILFINVSWGLGAGIIIDGNLYKGKSGYAGEIGHNFFTNNELICHCGKKGCLETEVSGSALVRIVKERLNNGESSSLALSENGDFTLQDVVTATCNEDTLCIDVIESMGYKLGQSIAGLINIFNPELVIVGGILSMTGEYFIHSIKSAILKYSLNLVNKDTKVVLSKLKEKAGVVGSCMIARKNFLQI